MARCLRCGETDLLPSDICGDAGCVYCYYEAEALNYNSMNCLICGEEQKVLSNNCCNNCISTFNSMSNEDRENLIKIRNKEVAI